MTDSDEVRKVEVGWGAWCHDDDLGNISEVGKYWEQSREVIGSYFHFKRTTGIYVENEI